jgi:hypothetical protein
MNFGIVFALLVVLTMVLVTPAAAAFACESFAGGLKNLVNSNGSNHATKACVICDRSLEWNDNGFITMSWMESLQTTIVW